MGAGGKMPPRKRSAHRNDEISTPHSFAPVTSLGARQPSFNLMMWAKILSTGFENVGFVAGAKKRELFDL
jgi:hypothetical protein